MRQRTGTLIGFPLIILVTLTFVSLSQASRYTMSESEQGTKVTDQAAECGAGDDVEMSSQLTDAPESFELEEDACNGAEGGDEKGGDVGGEKEGGAGKGDQVDCQGEAGQAAETDSQQEATQVEDSQTEMSQSDASQSLPIVSQSPEASGLAKEAGVQGAEATPDNQETMVSQSSGSSEEVDDEPKPKPTFPKTLEEFGYHFNKDGQLRSIEDGEPFIFELKKKDKKYNQVRYEALGEVITEFVYGLLETETHLEKHLVPVKRKKSEPQSFIFTSPDALTNQDKLMLLIHGSGVVRAGQWARSLIINDCLNSGTQLPYIKRAMHEGYGVIVLNTNYNRAEPEGILIRDNGSPKEHAQYVWKHFVKNAKAKRIYIVAHSFGGVVTVDLASLKYDQFKKRVHKIAFTDSVHTLNTRRISPKAQTWLIKNSVNWVSSDLPLNEPVDSSPNDIQCRSAGTLKHVETSWLSFDPIFQYFSEP